MRTRIMHTRYWQDSFVLELSRESKLLFIYLLTNQYINICGIYELPDKVISMETGLTETQLKQGKEDLVNKVVFSSGWVRVLNVEKYNSYRNSPKNEVAFTREMGCVPPSILDTSIDTSIDTPINPKSEIINHKSETIKKDFKNLASLTPTILKEVSSDYGVPLLFVEDVKENLELYIGSTGKHYKDYRLALINWVKKDRDKLVREQKNRKRGGVYDARTK